MQHLLQAFLPKQHLMVLWLNRAIIVLYQGFCCIKDIRIYIVVWIIYDNVATEITCLQKNIVALQNLTPLRIQPPSNDSKVPPRLLKSSPQSHIFFSHPPPPPPPSFVRGCILWVLWHQICLISLVHFTFSMLSPHLTYFWEL